MRTTSTVLKTSLLALAIALGACGESETPPPTPPADAPPAASAAQTPAPTVAGEGEVKGFESQLQSILSMAHRSEANKARDVYRHPAETLSFLVISPTLRILTSS